MSAIDLIQEYHKQKDEEREAKQRQREETVERGKALIQQAVDAHGLGKDLVLAEKGRREFSVVNGNVYIEVTLGAWKRIPEAKAPTFFLVYIPENYVYVARDFGGRHFWHYGDKVLIYDTDEAVGSDDLMAFLGEMDETYYKEATGAVVRQLKGFTLSDLEDADQLLVRYEAMARQEDVAELVTYWEGRVAELKEAQAKYEAYEREKAQRAEALAAEMSEAKAQYRKDYEEWLREADAQVGAFYAEVEALQQAVGGDDTFELWELEYVQYQTMEGEVSTAHDMVFEAPTDFDLDQRDFRNTDRRKWPLLWTAVDSRGNFSNIAVYQPVALRGPKQFRVRDGDYCKSKWVHFSGAGVEATVGYLAADEDVVLARVREIEAKYVMPDFPVCSKALTSRQRDEIHYKVRADVKPEYV